MFNITFHTADPIVILYRPIDKLQNPATTAGILYSQAKQLEFGLTLICNTRYFKKDLGKWIANPDAYKTWDNLKTYFMEAQTELKEIWVPTMHQSCYHHANMLATQLRADLDAYNSHMLAM